MVKRKKRRKIVKKKGKKRIRRKRKKKGNKKEIKKRKKIVKKKREKKKEVKKKEKVIKGREKKRKRKIKTQSFFGFINKFINFIKNIKTRPKNLEIKEEEGVGRERKKEEEYVDILDILNEKRTEEEKEIPTSNMFPVIKELLDENQEFPQLDDDARLEITKAISDIKTQDIPQISKLSDNSVDENIKSFMNNMPTTTELVKNLKIKEEEEIDDNRKEFRERLKEELNRINKK